MGAQAGCLSAFQLGNHDHLSDERGGILNAYSRDGAFRKPYRTGALAIHCDNDPVRDTGGPDVWTKLKEIRINADQPGAYRITWRMRNSDNVTNVFSCFYVNGLPVSAVQNTTLNVMQAKNCNYDVPLIAGDLLQIYGKPETDAVYVDQFRIYYDWGLSQFGDGGRINLVTLLPLSSVDLLDFTNQDP